jgi:hypothetical protein
VSQAEDDPPILPAEAEAALLALLEAALRPEPLDPETGERLLQMALEDPLAEPSPEELVESARLRDALASGGPHEHSALLGALRAPFETSSGDAPRVERALSHALEAGTEAVAPPRGKLVYAWFGAASVVLAAAAAVALFVSPLRQEAPASSAVAAAAPSLVRPHSTADLFAERFETSATSERMDLIASARGRDLRDNRYAAWGVR